MVDTRDMLAVFLIPFILLILLSISSSFTEMTASQLGTTVTNETVGNATLRDVADSPYSFTTTYDAVKSSVTSVSNNTDLCVLSSCYNVSYEPRGVATVTVGGLYNGSIYVTYEALYSDSYTSFEAIETGQTNSYNLSALVPYALIGFMVLGLLLGYLGVI